MSLFPDDSLVCSTITFRRDPLDEALQRIRGLGFTRVDLGAFPGFCDHFDPLGGGPAEASRVRATLEEAGMTVCTINSDPGQFNDRSAARASMDEHFKESLELARGLGTPLAVGCGAPAADREWKRDLDTVVRGLHRFADLASEAGVRLLVEAPHFHRLCHTSERTLILARELEHSGVGFVLDISHAHASGGSVLALVDGLWPRIAHVHVRDAVPGDIHLAPGDGSAPFDAVFRRLAALGYRGAFSLELEVEDDDPAARAAAVEASVRFIRALWRGEPSSNPTLSEPVDVT